jgi:hypothetical protein
MGSPLRLAIYMLLGTGCGVVFGAEFLLSYYHGYDHGFGEGQRCVLAGSILGAMAGLGIFIAQCRAQAWRFSVSELLLVMTLAAATLGIAIPLLRWAASY